MALSLKFYADSALTTEITSVTINQLADGSTGDVDKVVYLGSTVATSTFEASSDPGVDDIEVSIVDADPGSGVEATDIKLASTLSGLDTAVAGDPLVIGTSLDGGVANAVPIYIRSATPALSASSTEITLETNNITETL